MREVEMMRSARDQDITPLRTVITSLPTADHGKVRLGGVAPALPPVRVTPGTVADSGKVRLGGMSPSLPPVRAN